MRRLERSRGFVGEQFTLLAMNIVAIIPARLESTRLARKMLKNIGGVPLIGRVYEAVRASSVLADVIVATDSEEIFELCKREGWNPRMTAETHRSGTERVHPGRPLPTGSRRHAAAQQT